MTTLPTRRIPALDRDVSALGLGCMGLSWAYVRPNGDERAALDVLRHAVDAGVTFFDTSDVYGAGHNEQLLGEALARRDDVVVATKAGLVGSFIDGQYRLLRNGHPDHLRRACDESLQRLGRDAIDLYYLHRIDPTVPLEESWGALSDLVRAGKVRALGLSEVSVAEAAAAHAVHPVAAIQSELSLWTRDPLGHGVTADGEPAGTLVSWARESEAVFVPFSPLGRGFLADDTTEAPGDLRSRHPHFPDRHGTDERDVVEVVDEVAARRGVSSAAVALAWLLARGPHVIPIPGTKDPEHLDENLEALRLELTPEDLADLDGVPQAVGGGA